MILVWLMVIPFVGGFLCWQGERFGRGFPRWVGLITMSIVLGLSLYLWYSGDYSQTLLNPSNPQWVAEFKADW
ncbi:MAG: NADH-quinone oxidoreductase subunit M, partial [Nevskia sp.]|nr:NADH-quinone oxidoreductase subunit M [Nevskia sp.]